MVNWIMILIFGGSGLILIGLIIGVIIFVKRMKMIRICIIGEGEKTVKLLKGGVAEYETKDAVYFVKKEAMIRQGLRREIYFNKGSSYPIDFATGKSSGYNAQEIKDITKTKIIRDILASKDDMKMIVFFVVIMGLVLINIIVTVVVK